MSGQSPLQDAFESAKRRFLQSLTEREESDFSQFTSIKQVYDETDRIQKEQGGSGRLRNLRRIQPFLDCMNQYSGVLDTFVQAKPDILSLIWGPIKLLLQVSCTLIQSYDKILEAMVQIGDCLPQFERYTTLFQTNGRVIQVLCIFYEDILEFHATALNFFKIKRWRILFESIWPRYARKISVVLNNISRHRMLMDSEVTLANISEAYAARVKTHEEFERTQAFQQRQELEHLKSTLSPHLYDSELERLRKPPYVDAGHWLDKDATFKRWLDPDDLSTRLFWLVGIPGAGKTFVSSMIVLRLNLNAPNLLFAFLNYQDTQASTTLKVLHSFLFQLLLAHKTLQPILAHAYESNYRQLSTSVDFVKSLLCNLLECIGTTYVVMDGIDEVNDCERQILLKTSLDVFKSAPHLKLLISSREETDISRLLKPVVRPIRLDHYNLDDIKTYVEHRTDTWLLELNADDSTSSEIRKLVKPVASKAEGMFLYARLVMDNLESQVCMEDIREEASNLPNGLEEAYGRIISRIQKKLPPKQQAQARQTLQWVGCAASPLRRKELYFALSIRPGDTTVAPDRKRLQDVVQLCGPVIEFVDDFVVFVHFTVKEFLFGSQSGFFLKETEAHRYIASVCISYLGSDCFSTDLSDLEINSAILSGKYVLQAYAESHWLKHIQQGSSGILELASVDELCRDITRFIGLRKNQEFEDPSGRSSIEAKHFRIFRKYRPQIYEILCAVSSFYAARQRGLSLKDGENWKNLDPFTTSSMSLRIRHRVESMLCGSSRHQGNCECAVMQTHYGTHLFKCILPACGFYRIGFQTVTERDTHQRTHDRPYKCTVLKCDFSSIGFTSKGELNQHTSQCHTDSGPVLVAPAATNELDPHEFLPIMLDAVKAGEVAYVSDHVSLCTGSQVSQLLGKAAGGSSLEMVELLLSSGARINEFPFPLNEAVAADQTDIVAYLLSHGADVETKRMALRHAFEHLSYEPIRLLLDHGASFESRYDMYSSFQTALRRAVDGEGREKFKKCILLITQFHHESVSSQLLGDVAHINSSIPIAKFLLENGANINAKSPSTDLHRRGYDHPSLYYAAKNQSKLGAEFMKFLLLSGADPTIRSDKGKLASSLKGAKNIFKHLGMTWDELVEWAKNEREAAIALGIDPTAKMLAELGHSVD